MGNKHGGSKPSKVKDKFCARCDTDFTDNVNPLMRAARAGHRECLRAILRILDKQEALDDVMCALTRDNKTALIFAIQNGNHECAELLIKAGDDANYPRKFPPILEAVRRGHPKCVDVLLQSEIDIGQECCSLNRMIRVAQRDHGQCVDVLRHTGADMNVVLSIGEAALICAIANCFLPCLISLLHAGVDVNIDFRSRSSPLIVAAAAGSRGLACMKMLLTVGAHVNITNTEGKNALQICITRSKDTKKDIHKCLLLFAAGEYLDLNAKSFTFMGQTYMIPVYLKEFNPGICLKHLCREAIRKHLIFLNPHLHLFGRIPELGQPSLITSYLLYGMSLE